MGTQSTSILGEGLRIEPIEGPHVEPIEADAGSSVSIGRSMQNDLVLLDGSVSREHALVQHKSGRWLLTDLGSRHGTRLNGVAVEPGDPSPVESGDQIRIGPWMLRVLIGDDRAEKGRTGTASQAAVIKGRRRGEVVQEVDAESLGRLAQHRLDLLFEYASTINAAADEAGLGAAVVESALSGSGFGRGALLRAETDGSGCEIIASSVRGGGSWGGLDSRFDISASLLAKAAEGKPAILESIGGGAMPDYGQSVMDLRIHAALCVPVLLGDRIEAYLYLDARGRESGVQPDATGFCVALARLCGLAMSSLVRRELEKRHAEMEVQLGAAREAQQMILPPLSGDVGGLRYALRMRPGLYVAGDMFDIVELGPGRVAVFLGDVTGEGIGAGLLMASGQAHLHALLLQHGDPERAVNELNRYLAEHSPLDRFISLWAGLFDRDAGTLAYVDAGHGHWVVIPAGGRPRKEASVGGIPAAIDPDVIYRAQTIPFSLGDRLVVFSDGVIEQSGAGSTRSQDQFGIENVIGVLSESDSSSRDVESVMRAVLEHAGGVNLDDDTTIASVQWGDPGDRPVTPESPTSR